MSDEQSNPLGLEEIQNWDALYWSYNLPLQMWKGSDGTTRVLNYMPRKGRCQYMDESVSAEDRPAFCRNAARILRNLADLMEAYGRGEIDRVYYPDKPAAEAIRHSQGDGNG